MMVLPVILGLAAFTAVTLLVKRSLAAPVGTPSTPLTASMVKSSIIGPLDHSLAMVPVTLPNGEVWEVTKDYVAGPVGINEAATIVKNLGLELPSPALVDAIWRQADLKLVPLPRNNVISQAVFDDQVAKIEAQKAGKDFTLVGGQFKDVVNNSGHTEIYGWHVDVEHGATVPGVPLLSPKTPGPGKIIQPPSGKAHDQPGPVGFKDYSQGARGVRRIA